MLTVRQETASMWTRDRVRLDADIYRPAVSGDYPVLLMRQPYGRAIASTIVYAHPSWYAAQGYIVVIQDVRGRGTSEGKFSLFASEIADGEDTVHWVANLPGSTGAVGMYGFSYQGMTQLYAAAAHPTALKTICPAMIGYDLYADWAYEGGAFCLQANLGWALQLAAETARIQGDESAYVALTQAAKNLPLSDRLPARPDILSRLAPDSFYHAWLDHPEPDAYWQALSPQTHLQAIDLPMLHIGGWYDPFLRGTLHLYRDMAARSQFRQQLIVGPWAHLPWGRKVGAVDFGAAAASPCDRLQVRWFDHFLKGSDASGFLTEPPVHLFELGRNQWRSQSGWNSVTATPFYLATSGLAGLSDREGQLLPTPSSPQPPDVFVHDPWRPVPAVGGHAATPAGMIDRSSVDCRTDVLTYTTAPLTTDLHLNGSVTAHLFCHADRPSFDLCAVLSEVRPSGAVYPLSQGYRRIATGQPTAPVTIALQPICACIPVGHALRLSLSAACFPAYSVNPGTGAHAGNARLLDQQIITVTIDAGGDRASWVGLPVTSGAHSE
jgi:putative CocE/NonD family hydrolase